MSQAEYQRAINDQQANHDPQNAQLEYGPSFLLREWGELPLWAIPFSEKPFKPDTKRRYTSEIDTDEMMLDRLSITREYDGIQIERELIQSTSGIDTLIERLFQISKVSGKSEIYYTLIISNNPAIDPDLAQHEYSVRYEEWGNPISSLSYRLTIADFDGLLRDPEPLVLR